MADAPLHAALDESLRDAEMLTDEDMGGSVFSISAATAEAAHEATVAAQEEAGRRMAVAREQMAEFATQRATDLESIEQALVAFRDSLPAAAQQQCTQAIDLARQALEDSRMTATEAAKDAAQQRGADGAGTSASALLRVAKRGRDDEGDEAPNAEAEASAPAPAAAAAAAATGTTPQGSVCLADAHPREVARYIPMRLETPHERNLLRLLESALHVSEYTDKVDILSYSGKTKRVQKQLMEVCAILSGLLVATDYRAGQELVTDRNFADNATFFQCAFEVGRRHKVLNPEKMRGEYGKLMYLLMDAQNEDIRQLLEFELVKPLKTVHARLEEAGMLNVLDDPLVVQATAEIREAQGKPRAQVQREIKAKEAAREALVKKYTGGGVSLRDRDVMKSLFGLVGGGGASSTTLRPEELRQCLYSLSDHNAYLRFNKEPVDTAIKYLEGWFASPDSAELQLSINVGMNGARLSHNHARQYTYVRQTLYLWREIMGDMFRLWCLAEDDLLKRNSYYRLTDTGQGLNRVQAAPKVSSAMHGILNRCMHRLGGGWVGSSVVHLGDHNVPNALMFIDKYTQVPRILGPLIRVVEEVERACRSDAKVSAYVESVFGTVERCQKIIMCDFFKHAFDGSGADNFFDAGSCIDGRLTSAWNWCSKVEKKVYWPVFKLCGFAGFDGDFK